MKNILFIAPPAGGKGTQSDNLVENFGYIHISTGDLLREVDKNSDLGREVNSYISKGLFVPDDVVLALLKEKLLTLKPTDSFILDGYPRNISQAETLDNLLSELNMNLDLAIELDVPYDVLLSRVVGRVSCPKCKTTYNTKFMPPHVEGICDKCGTELIHRDDDSESTFKTRFDTYLKNTAPLIDFYKNRGKLKVIDGINDTYNAIVSVIK